MVRTEQSRDKSALGDTSRPLILHVTECFEGGVSRAIRSLVDNAPQFDHALLALGDDYFSPDDESRFVVIDQLSGSPLSRVISVHRNTARRRVDLVHAHSSWAGVYTRLSRLSAPVIYQPHGYAIEMGARWKRVLYGWAERQLARNTDAVVVLTQRECDLAQKISPTTPRHLLPNVPTVPNREPPSRGSAQANPKIVMVGRLCEQKDPNYFATLAELVLQTMPSAQFVWIGDGDPEYKNALSSAGATVTGWLKNGDLISELDSADLYVHTAAYEGFPLSALDAAARGLPIIARAIPPFDGTSVWQDSGMNEHAQSVLRFFQEPSWAEQIRDRSKSLLQSYNADAQAEAALRLYKDVVRRGPRFAGRRSG